MDPVMEDLEGQLLEKIRSGRGLIERLKSLDRLDGAEKLARKIQQEIRFLEKVQASGNVKKEHLQSTNLIHLNAMVVRLFRSNRPISVMRPFKHQNSRLEVDIVCDGGATWVKVIARNARALTLISTGDGEYGQKSVLDQAECYLECAKGYPHMYSPLGVVFHFAYGIETPLADRLETMGVIVEGDRIGSEPDQGSTVRTADRLSENSLTSGTDAPEVAQDEPEGDPDSDLDKLNARLMKTEINVLNLDVSTLLAYVTNMTNGFANFVYREPLLSQQAEMERMRPVKPILEKLFKDKELRVCRTAYDNFMNIIDVIGGPKETSRAKELLARVNIVDDLPTGRIMNLGLAGKIKDRSRLVFATGENMKSITVSANEGFVRAARMQGIECTVFLHEPRSLSEIKEGHAETIWAS